MPRTVHHAVITAAVAVLVAVGAPTADAAGPGAVAPAVAPTAATAADPGTYAALAPQRILDTRTGTGAPKAPLAAHGTVHLAVLGVGGLPETAVGAVVLNVTAVRPARPGYVTVFPDGESRPTASNLNVVAGETVATLVVAKVGGTGGVALFNGTSGPLDLVADVSGYYLAGDATAPGAFVPRTPARVLDTRSGKGAPRSVVAAHRTVTVQVSGDGGVPVSGVAAVAVGVTDVRPERTGYVTAYAAGSTRPTASTLNAPAGRTIANLAVVPLDGSGRMTLYNGSSGTTNLVADVFGYYLAGDASATGAYVPLAPTRILDTRKGIGATAGLVAGHGTIRVQATGVGAVPTTPVSAVVVNLTATGATTSGYVTAFRADRPAVSSLNDGPGRTVANLTVVPVDRLTGTFGLYNGSANGVHLVADVQGYVLAPASVDYTWTDEGVVHPLGGSDLREISCPTADFCAGVDDNGHAILWHGGPSWSQPVLFDPTATTSYTRRIACASADLCVVEEMHGQVIVYDGHTWSTPQQVAADGVDVGAIACTPGGACRVATTDGAERTVDGTGWSAPESVEADGFLRALSCPSTDFCVGADTLNRTVTFDGSSWSAPVDQSAYGTMIGLSCPSPTFCGAYTPASLLTSTDGVTWTSTSIQGLGGYAPNGFSCTSDGHCLVFTSAQSTVMEYDGTSWSAISPFPDPAVDPQQTALGCSPSGFCALATVNGEVATRAAGVWSDLVPWDGYLRLTLGVSCATADLCVGVDMAGFAYAYAHGTWQPQQFLGTSLTQVSCPTETFCLAMGEGPTSYTYDGSTWTERPGVWAQHAVDCAAPHFCAAVDTSGRVMTFGGTSWSVAPGPGYGTDAVTVSCASADFCAVTFGDGRVATMRDGVWGPAEDLTGGPGLTSVSCPSDRFCLAGDDAGRAFTYDGTTWDPTPAQVDPAEKALHAVSCASDDRCVASGVGGTWVYTWNSWADAPSLPTDGSVSCPDPSLCLVISSNGHAYTGRL